MKNIKAVRLENFQSHLDTYIEFGDGLNVIVGQSDSGKTAILRGIRWVLYNQPRGTDFIRVSGDFVRVSITFENETVIIRERTGSKNRYTIKKAGHEDLVLEGFGIHVPEEVIESHGMGLMRIDHDNELMIHLSQQLDGPFLLEQTSSIRAKTLGRISGAHFLDMAIRDTTKDLSQLNLKMKQEQAIIEQLNSDLEPFNGLSELQHKLVSSEQRIEKVKTMLKRKEKLVKLQSKWVQMKKEEELASTKKRLVKDVDNWDEGFNRVQQLVQRFLIFKQKKQRNDELKRSIQICHNWIEKTQHTGTVSSNYERLLDEVKQVQKFKEHAVI
ncbi:AAA family ATPase [Halalkalibacter akibai]|uniref:Nuclease SbcCD subunit C n=1 Tax=Halalkalibacter akibai (strain ATCC 43226 / DSM 21942 / CIP 109018 / JCM 9157 / 1139) TaxID=1236973 RepID=W4QRX4_HALA3|nr:AAA family ATPase [Halalkalibacter akibai]GAE34677.1 DNA double-strand break repair Rad50 ATPase [Halalkalibacter akibai JCM 9157]